MATSLHMTDGKPPMHISYPFNSLAKEQKSNHKQAIAVQKSHERRVIKDGILDQYNEEMQKALKAGNVVELSQEEMNSWKGGVHYITLFAVMKPSSTSTKARIVSDSKMKNNITGKSFNDLIKTVPNALSDGLVVLLNWREHPTTIIYDLSKAYQSIKTGLTERHLRRFFYRSSPTEPFKTYAIDCNNYGDACASLGLELGKEKTAELGKPIDPQASEQLVQNSFVDDVAGGGTIAEVLRMRGQKNNLGEYSGTIPKVLAAGGFRAKALTMSGNCDDEEKETLGNKFLGIGYCPKSDMINMQFTTQIRLDDKKTSKPKLLELNDVPDEEFEDLLNLKSPLTKRKVLLFMMSQYDPLGLIAPLLLIGKLLLRSLYGKENPYSWDDHLPENIAKPWLKYIQMLVRQGPIAVPCSLRTEDCRKFWLVGFWDGSLQAHSAVIYARCTNVDPWDVQSFDSNLVISKSRVSPMSGTTIPRMELQGLLQATRLMVKVVQALKHPVDRVILAGDSACSIMALKKDGISFTPFFQHRIAEIQENLNIIATYVRVLEPVRKIQGKLNPADLSTRNTARPNDLKPESIWIKGPEFFKTPRNSWPLTDIEESTAIPSQELRKVHSLQSKEVKTPLKEWVLQRCKEILDLDKAKGVIARCLKAGKMREKIIEELTAEERWAAQQLILMANMGPTVEAWKKGKLESLKPFSLKGIIYTQGRYSDSKMLRLVGVSKLPILMASTRAAEMITWKAHKQDHCKDINGLLFRVRRTAWVIKGRGLVKRVVKSCAKCRLDSTKVANQLMGDLPDFRIDRADPFTVIAVDLFGPLWAKGLGGHARKTFKVWGVLFVCLATKAVSIWTALSYSTKDFMLCYEKHSGIYNYPKTVISDQGTQLVAAGNDVNWIEIQHSTASKGTTWQFTPKGCPWRNGMAERSIGVAKTILKQVVNRHQVLNFAELETTFIKVSSIMNRRPLTARLYNEDEFVPIAPADLLLGRATSIEDKVVTVWEEPEQDITNLQLKHDQISQVVKDWWTAWERDSFPLFCPRKKWTTTHRNLQIGDIVLLKYEQQLGKDKFNLAKVTNVHPDKHNIIRTVTVSLLDSRRARNEKSNESKAPQKSMIVGVQRLVVILPVEEIWSGGLLN